MNYLEIPTTDEQLPSRKPRKPSREQLVQRLSNHRNRLARFYDNGGPENGGSFDRYTAAYLEPLRDKETGHPLAWGYVGMSASPSHGFGQHGETKDGPCDFPPPSLGRLSHLGKRIRFADLPPDCQRLVVRDLLG